MKDSTTYIASRVGAAVLALAATIGLLAMPSLSHAAEVEVTRQTVHFADLDLDSLDGNAALYRRLVRAANDVCADPEGVRALGQAAEASRCREQALADAVARVDRPMLSLIHGDIPVPVVLLRPMPGPVEIVIVQR